MEFLAPVKIKTSFTDFLKNLATVFITSLFALFSNDGAILNLFVTTDTLYTIFPAGINEWRKCIEINYEGRVKCNLYYRELFATKTMTKTVEGLYSWFNSIKEKIKL